jgi:hypothetical protein
MNVCGSGIMHMEGIKKPEKRSEGKKCEPGEA